MRQAVELVADERRQGHQRHREHPPQTAQQTRHERQFDRTVHKQVSGGKMPGASSQVLRHVDCMGCENISRVFGQFLAGQRCNHVPDRGPRGHEQGNGPHQLDATVRTLEGHSHQEGAVCEVFGLYHGP